MKINRMNKGALKAGALLAVIVLVVAEALAFLVQLIDPQGGHLRVDYHNPVQHIIILAVAIAFGFSAYIWECRKNRNNE